MKHLTLVAVLVGVLSTLTTIVACEQPSDVVSCKQEWTCEAGIVAEKDPADPELENKDELVFCTDPNDPDRDADIAAYETEFAETCDGTPVNCIEGGQATCLATCTTGGGACDLATKRRVRLD